MLGQQRQSQTPESIGKQFRDYFLFQLEHKYEDACLPDSTMLFPAISILWD